MQLDARARLFSEVLVANAPSPELGERAKDLDWLVGGWSAIVRDYHDDGSVAESSGEWWFSWVLEGRALLDVWVVPPRSERKKALRERNRYGATIRFFDPAAQLWRIVWINPVSGIRNELAGRREGDSIMLEGTDGTERIRWSFNDISANSFLWRGEHLSPDGTWKVGAEFHMTRKEQSA